MGKPFRLSYFNRLVLIGVALTVLSVVVTSAVSRQLITSSMEEHLGKELLAMVSAVAPLIDGDAHENIFRSEDGTIEGQPQFAQIYALLQKSLSGVQLRGHGGSSPLYTLRPSIDFERSNTLEFVVMSHGKNQGTLFIGNRIRAEAHHLKVLGGQAAMTPLYEDSEGLWISAAAPVRDAAGEVVAILQADRPISYFDERVFEQSLHLMAGATAVMVVTVILYLVTLRRLLRPLGAVVDAATRLGQGQFDTRLTIRRSDEIGVLAATFNSMAEHVEASQKELRQKVEQATADLRDAFVRLEEQNKNLEEAKSQAEIASAAKGTFLANMSHELRTPLNAIIGYTEIVIENQEDHDLHEDEDDLRKILSSAKHLLSLVNDVLDISRIEAGKMTFYFEQFWVSALVDELIALVQPMADKRRTRLIVKHEESLPMYSDITRVRQLLFNLLSNACKFTENGSVELSVERCEVNAVPGYRFSVRDTGIGMSPDQQRNLFQMFTQADSSTTRKYGGSGVGLALCAKLVELMHGSIALESALGKGTTATIWLPKEAERPTQTVTPTAHPPGRLIESSHDTVKS